MPQTKSKKSVAGTGSIRKKTVTRNGKPYTYWEGRLTVGIDPGTGKQKQRSITGKTQKEVAQKLRQLTVEVDNHVYVAPAKMTVAEWLAVWADQYLIGLKPYTIDAYKKTVNRYLVPALGKKKLENLKPADIQAYYTALNHQEKPLSAKTVRNIHGVLHKALQQAVDLGYLHSNPSDPCKPPKWERKPIQALDSVAIQAFMQTIKGHHLENLFLVTLFTGMRKGEVLGLTWECVDFQSGTILIGQQLQHNVNGEKDYFMLSPKNGKARKVTPAPFVMDILKRQHDLQSTWAQAAGEAWIDRGLVFTNEIGDYLNPHTVYKNFKQLIAEAGYPDTRFHDLRHSYAVAAIQSGDDIKTVQENLGHHTAAFTLDVYGHVTDQMKQASADRMQRYISSLQG